MKKVDIDMVEHSMLQAGIAQVEVNKVIADLKAQLEELAAQKQSTPRVEKIKYIVANTSQFSSDTKITELPCMVVEAEDSVPWHSVVDEISVAAAGANNDHSKLKKDPVKTVFDAIERVPPKYFKEKHIRVISKEMVQILETDNKL